MKKIILLIGVLFLMVSLFICGCSQAPSSSTSTTTPATSDRITSFLGVTLGSSKTDTASILGNPTSSTGDYYKYQETASYYLGVQYTNGVATWIDTTSSIYKLNGVGIGSSFVQASNHFGTPDLSYDFGTYYEKYWNKYGIGCYFYTSDDLCYRIGIYSGDY